MSACCVASSESESEGVSGSKPKTQKRVCPVCEKIALDVTKRTMLQHINNAWLHTLKDEQYFYCRTKDCNVVYFSENDEVINKDNVRTHIGIKEKSDSALICYCFGVSKAAADNEDIKNFVIKQTKESNCACEIANPSGRCCLKDFPKFK